MNKNTGVVIGVIVLLLVVGGVYVSKNNKDDSMMVEEEVRQKAMEVNDAIMNKDDAGNDEMIKKEDASMMDKGDTMMKAGSYEAYSPEKVMLASDTHDVVLFFRASWCPTCRAVDSDIRTNLSKIPASLAILDVDYDNSTSLKQKYAVTYQHTFVQVDKDGKMIKKWSGSPTLATLVSEVK